MPIDETVINATTDASLGKDFAPAPKPQFLRGLINLEPYHPDSNDELYSKDDKGIARLFADVFKSRHRYNSTRGNWMFYDGKRWVDDERGLKAFESLKKLQASLVYYAQSNREYYDFVVKYGSTNKRKNVLYDAQSVYPVTNEELDSNPYLFNCQDCTYDLHTFRPRKHSPDDLLTKVSNVQYNHPSKSSEAWNTFIDQIMQGDKEKAKYLQRAIGYTLTTSTEEECFFILFGSTTRNGKSTFIETILHLFGDYGTSTEPATFQTMKMKDGGRATPQIANLAGCRFLKTSEPPQNMTFDCALLKTLTGSDTVPARRLYEAQFEFKPQFKLFMNTNHLPRVTDTTLFEGDRVRVITFDKHFTEEEQDRKLRSKLCKPESISGIFEWALQGYEEYLRYGLQEPQSVKDAVKQYEQDSDTIGQYISEVLIPLEDKWTDGGLAYEAYRKWIATLGQQPLGRNGFFRILRERNLLHDRAYVQVTASRKEQKRNVILDYMLDEDWNPYKKNA